MKKLISFVMIISILAININTYATVINRASDNDKAIEKDDISINRIADKSTVDDYKNIITNTTEQGTRNNGRVWTDKSVYSKDNTKVVTLDDKFEIKYDEDFLNVFSALGSSEQIYGKQSSPLDVVLLLDVSTSMTTKAAENNTFVEIDNAKKVIEQANKLIKTLMGEDESKAYVHKANRIGVVAYAGGSQVLLPLDHYTSTNNGNYLTIESNKAGSKYWPQITTTVNNDKQEFTNKTSKYMFADSTYLQGALYQGMHMLATEEDTTYINPNNNKEINRIPVLIVFTDGGTNVVGATNTKENSKSIDWWNPLSWVEDSDPNTEAILPTCSDIPSDYRYYVPVPNGNPFYVSIQKGEDNPTSLAIAPRTLSTLMTAGYMKNWIEDNYNSKSVGNKKIKFKGFGISYNVNNENELVQLNSTINPKKYFVSNSDNEQIQKAYSTLQEYLLNNGQVPTMEFGNYSWIGKNLQATWKFNHPTGEEAKYDIKSVEDLYYIDECLVSENAKIEDSFDYIIDKIINDTFIPIEGDNGTGTSDSLSYIDPIGEYLEVKGVSDLLLFGERYKVIEDEADSEEKSKEKEGYSYKYYRAVGTQNEDVTITNPSYTTENQKQLSDIKIWVEKENANSMETLHIEIPNKLIPIKLDKITFDKQQNIEKYESNIGTNACLPIRIAYEVGISDEILKENEINLSKVSKDYKLNNSKKEDGKIYTYFYSNYYNNEIYDKETQTTLGNAKVIFKPSLENKYYIFQKNSTIYKNILEASENGKGIKTESGASVTLSDEVTDLNEINENQNYYFTIEYYVPQEGENGEKGKLIQYVVSQKGSDFFDDSECYLTYYDTQLDKEVTEKGENTVVATKIGGKRIESLRGLKSNKAENITETATNYYAPQHGGMEYDNSIVTYLGNNGRLNVEVLTGVATIKKVGENGEALEGAVFGLYAKDDIYFNNEIIYKAGEEIDKKATNKAGVIEFLYLYDGSYEIKELQAPKGYALLEDTISFELPKENLEYNVTVENKKIEKENPPKEDPPKEDPPKEDPPKEETPKENPKDNETKPSLLPKAGDTTNLVLMTLTLDIASFSVVFYIKYRKLKKI